MTKRIYLASPYSDQSLKVRNNRYLAVCKAAGELIAVGELVFSPIAHSHGIATVCNLPIDWDYWKRSCRAEMESCDLFWVLMLRGWSESVGIGKEHLIARELGMVPSYHAPSCFGITEETR